MTERLRVTFQQEGEADLLAMAGDFGTASRLMRWVNKERADALDLPRDCDPNYLREKARDHLPNKDSK